MDQERNQSMFFRARHFGRLEQKILEIYTVLRFDYLCFKRISAISPIIGDVGNTNWNIYCDAQKRKKGIPFVSASQDIFDILAILVSSCFRQNQIPNTRL